MVAMSNTDLFNDVFPQVRLEAERGVLTDRRQLIKVCTGDYPVAEDEE